MNLSHDNRRPPAEVPPLSVWILVILILGLVGIVVGILVLNGVDLTRLLATTGEIHCRGTVA